MTMVVTTEEEKVVNIRLIASGSICTSSCS
jgi:hypothetical protein